MKKQVWLERLGFVCLFLFLVSLAITLTINFRPLYWFEVDHLNLLDYTSLTREELLKNYGLLLDFLNNPFASTLALPDFPMSEAVVSIKLCCDDRHGAAEYLVRQSVTAKTTAMALDSSLSMGDDFAADFRVFDGCRL